jgi:hypothetical protein
MRSYKGTYILSPINHKETYKLTDDTEIFISKKFENNLRERNPQLGIVEAVCEDNSYNLNVGDIVAVNHFTFYGDIGKDKSFILQDHVEYEGKKLFRVIPRQIFFKYNNQTPEPVGNFILCQNVEEKETLGFDPNRGTFFKTNYFDQKGTVAFGNDKFKKGDEVLVLKSAFYLVTLDKVDYFKVREDEIVAKEIDGEAVPVGNNFMVEYLPDEYQNGYSPLLVGTGVHITNNVSATVTKVSNEPVLSEVLLAYTEEKELGWRGEVAAGDKLQVYRQQGVPFNNKWIINQDNVVYSYEKA